MIDRLGVRIACIAILILLTSIRPLQAEFVITDKMVGLVFQCGQAVITITPDKQFQVTGLPYGKYLIEAKDGEIYIDGKLCKPICKALSQQSC